MPGHKRNGELLPAVSPYGIDITEIDGFDNLHCPESVLREAMDRCAELYGASRSYFLVNGSSAGILSAISACTCRGDRILIARNCHKSAYNALYLNDLNPVYLYPEFNRDGISGGINPSEVRSRLEEYPDCGTVILVSPTYEGIVSDVEAIAGEVHRAGGILIVDEAHGAHFGFHDGFPRSAVRSGADIVIQSTHKTLPAFTQSAVIHICGERVDRQRVEMYLSIYQSSSPSYILMGGLDRVMDMLADQRELLFNHFNILLEHFYERVRELNVLSVRCPSGNTREIRVKNGGAIAGCYDIDKSKIVISLKNTSITATTLYDILLRRYKLPMEMISAEYVLAMTGLGDREEGMDRLDRALAELDKELADDKLPGTLHKPKMHKCSLPYNWKAELEFTPYEASREKTGWILLEKSAGYIAGGGYVYLYPPGIPVIVPGERITPQLIELLKYYREAGLKVTGISEQGTIEVITGREII